MKKYWLIALLTPLLGFPGSGVALDGALENPNERCGGQCWAWVTSESGFLGDGWVICGPAQMRDLSSSERGDGEEWDDSVESLHTGPAATLHVWEDENYTGSVVTVPPNSIFRSLGSVGEHKRDLESEITSLQLECPEDEKLP